MTHPNKNLFGNDRACPDTSPLKRAVRRLVRQDLLLIRRAPTRPEARGGNFLHAIDVILRARAAQIFDDAETREWLTTAFAEYTKD